MTGEEFVLAVIAIVMGSSVVIVGITKITEIIRAWINRHGSALEDEDFNRLARAFMQHKKEMKQRVENLEAIFADEGSISIRETREIEAPFDNEETTLNNALEEKRKVRQ